MVCVVSVSSLPLLGSEGARCLCLWSAVVARGEAKAEAEVSGCRAGAGEAASVEAGSVDASGNGRVESLEGARGRASFTNCDCACDCDCE